MRSPTRTNTGLGILAVIICVGVLIILVGALTVSLAVFSATSSRYAHAVRARALAEAGVETALAGLTSQAAGKPEPVRFELDGGVCSVDVRPVANEERRLTVVSSGRLKLAGGEMICRVTLVVQSTDDGKPVRILSRDEDTRYLRVTPPKTSDTEAP